MNSPRAAGGLPGRTWRPGEPLTDVAETWPVTATERPFESGFVNVRRDTLRGPDGSFDRLVVEHHGAVGVLALDADGRVLLLRQYRHPIGTRLLEIPAGLLDLEDEPPQTAAARELAEESGVSAATWTPLIALWSSPGMTDEHWQVYLATDLSPAAPEDVPERHHEEADLEVVWVPFDDALEAVLTGRLEDAMAMVALLALWTRRSRPA